MRKLRLLILVILFSGCYTLLDHPEIEVYYEQEGQADSLVENYQVFVDEDCSLCHDDFLIQNHFSPLIPAHQTAVNWNYLPWWFDTKYLAIMSGNQLEEDNTSDSYQHIQSRQRSFGESPPSGGYLPASSGGNTASSGSAATSSQSNENSGNSEDSRSRIRNDNSDTQSNSEPAKTKRKFRKRK